MKNYEVDTKVIVGVVKRVKATCLEEAEAIAVMEIGEEMSKGWGCEVEVLNTKEI